MNDDNHYCNIRKSHYRHKTGGKNTLTHSNNVLTAPNTKTYKLRRRIVLIRLPSHIAVSRLIAHVIECASGWNEVPAQPEFSGHLKTTGLYTDMTKYVYCDSGLTVLLLSAPLLDPRSNDTRYVPPEV